MGCITSSNAGDRRQTADAGTVHSTYVIDLGMDNDRTRSRSSANVAATETMLAKTDNPTSMAEIDNPIYCELDDLRAEIGSYMELQSGPNERLSNSGDVEADVRIGNVLEEHAQCSICKGRYMDPKLLPCFHSYCLACLEKSQIAGVVICPNCNDKHKLAAEGAVSLPDCSISTALLSRISESESSYEVYAGRFLTCPQCKNAYTDPKILPCYHSFCVSCIEKLVTDGSVTCTKCATKHSVPESGPSSFPDASILSQSVRKEQKLPPEEEDEKESYICGGCSKNVGLKFCSDCSLSLCDSCSKTHENIPATKDHQMMTVTEFKEKISSETPKQCPAHSGHLSVSYCSTCDVPVCSACIDEEHKGPNHKHVPFEKAVATKQIHLLRDLAVLRSKAGGLHNLQKDYDYHDADADERYKHQEQKTLIGLQQLTQALTNALKYVEAETEAIIYDIKLEHNMEKSVNEDRKQKIKTSLNEAKFCIESGAHLVVQNDNILFLSMVGQTMENIKTLLGRDIAPPLLPKTQGVVTPEQKIKTITDTAYSIIQIPLNVSENANNQNTEGNAGGH
ncbi:E3 ubiquitin-protein ligase TRIM33-like [Ptychodera flava]|uniref:E3 ubiquitin-protein ligase TRIM33-like n=1 Tax=Ptychodera flava TaxID=63121 RepID=UPI003969FFBD